MGYKTKWRKIIASLIPVILLITIACNTITNLGSSVPVAGSTKTPVTEETSKASPSTFKPGDPTATPLGSEITDPNYIKGVQAIYANNDEEALALFNAAIEANPNLAPPYVYRGLAYWGVGDCASGLADEEKALSINPGFAAAWARRGLMYSCLGDDQQALQDYQKALSIDPSLAFVHHNLGYYYYTQGDYEKSLEEYSLSVAIDSNRSAAWSGKAEALTQLGRLDECLVNATKALEVNPEEWLAYQDRAYCEILMNNDSAAIGDYQKFLAHETTNVEAWNNLGLAQIHVGAFQDAVDSLSKALQLNHSYYQANINRGLAYTGLEKYEEALDDFNRTLEFGDIPAAYSGRGVVYYFQGKYEEAITDLELATQMNSNSARSYCVLAYTYFEVGRFEDALAAALKVEEISPECGGQKRFEVMIQSYYAVGRYEDGIAYITMTFEVRGQIYFLGYYYRGIMYDEIGKTQEAIKDLEFFLAAEQSFAEIYPEEIADAKARLTKLQP